MKKALIFSGGWDGHQPETIAERYARGLAVHQVEVDSFFSLECLEDTCRLETYDVIIPNWTMGQISDRQAHNLVKAIRGGVGLAGIHGGAGDAFRGCIDYEWMMGGHFVGHPHVGDYAVGLTPACSPITEGLPSRFAYCSEQYYMLVDPANEVLAEAVYSHEGRDCLMPVAWTKLWGAGRVFYSALGHDPMEFDRFPDAWTLALRGILWAAGVL